MAIDIDDFKDFRHNKITCDNCDEFMGCMSESILCEFCTYKTEEYS